MRFLVLRWLDNSLRKRPTVYPYTKNREMTESDYVKVHDNDGLLKDSCVLYGVSSVFQYM